MPSALAQLNLASPTWDLFIILFFLVFSLLYGFSLGRDRIIAIIVAIYMALAVVSNAPFLRTLDGQTVRIALGSTIAFRVTFFLSVFLVIFFLVSRSAIMGVLGSSESTSSAFQVMLFSILHVGLLLSVTLSFLPREIADRFAPLTRAIFLSDVGRFCWIVLPVIAMMMVRRPRGATAR